VAGVGKLMCPFRRQLADFGGAKGWDDEEDAENEDRRKSYQSREATGEMELRKGSRESKIL